ncbi:hypothetical protein J6590_004537 [Homalodisca vitripennis]|nr:hypothetical protein J6590_004537 [Homalodisca vitripennis]
MSIPEETVIEEREQCALVSNDFDWQYMVHNTVDRVSLDISHCGITNVPSSFLAKCYNMQYLYLEGNKLTELGEAFFPSLKHLKWLDVRNNILKTVPHSIADHNALQVLLLEGNMIEALPVEIGSLHSLRGIQLARNPIVYPPQNIINQGVQATIHFLRRQWQQLKSPKHIQLISETHSQTKTACPKSKSSIVKKYKSKASGCKSAVEIKASSRKPCKPRKVQSGLNAVGLSNCISVRPISQGKQPAFNNSWVADETDEIFCSIGHKRKNSSLNFQRKAQFHDVKTTRINTEEDKVQPKQLRDLWLEKIRQVLLTQEAILQRRRNAEALKQWREEAKTQQDCPKRDSDAEINFPYDTDPEYLKMMSRGDLVRDGSQRHRDSSLHNVRHEEPINGKILSIMAALQELQMSQTNVASPRSEQRVLAQEIKKIKDIQRSLNALKLKNFGQLALTS